MSACDCTDEYGPCEDHGQTLAQREGASLRTAHELCALFVSEVDDIRAAEGLPPVADQTDRARLEAVEGWLDEPDAIEWLEDITREADSSLPAGVVSYWDDGYVIVRLMGGPLTD
jgi:hypothetical protein